MGQTSARIVLPLLLVVAGAVPACAQSVASTSTTSTSGARATAPAVGDPSADSVTAAFIKGADEGNLAEIALASAAVGKTTNPDIKALAETLRRDHEQANQELGALAERKHVALSSTPSKAQQATIDRLQHLSGADFDEAYVTEVMKNHKADIAAFELHSHDPDPDVAAWTAKTLPLLQDHLRMAEDAETGVGVM